MVTEGYDMGKKIRMLLVEDEAITAMCLKMEFEQVGLDVCKVVASGEDAIISAKQEQPDLVLMDIQLGGEIDGIEAAVEISRDSRISIIFMTGYQESALKARTNPLQPIGYFVKPVKVAEIKTLIDSTLMGK